MSHLFQIKSVVVDDENKIDDHLFNDQSVVKQKRLRDDYVPEETSTKKRRLDSHINKEMKTLQSTFHTGDIDEFLSGPSFGEIEGRMNIYAYFKLVSYDQLSIGKPGVRGCSKTNINDYGDESHAKAMARRFLCGFQNICQLAGQRLEWFLKFWFQKRPQDFIFFLKSFCETPDNFVQLQIELEKQKRHMACGLKKADFILYIKDRLNMSNSSYEQFVDRLALQKALVNVDSLKKQKAEYNEVCAMKFRLTQISEGFVTSITNTIKYMIKSHNKEQEIRKNLKLPHVLNVNLPLRFKLSLDGRSINKVKSVLFGVCPLDLCTFNKQSRDSFFPICMWLERKMLLLIWMMFRRRYLSSEKRE